MAPHHPSIARALGHCRAIVEQVLDPRRTRLLVACSGGPDSVALLGLCDLLRHRLGLELAVGHVDHGLRSASAQEAEQVVMLSRRLGLPCEVTRVELAGGAGLPARARDARRQALQEQASRFGANAILLGHTATDQVETMLMHLVRGCGLDGIAAMPRVDPPWVRPLLDLTRDDTRELARRLQLPFFDDPTNTDPSHLRVRLRTLVLPVFQRENPRMATAFVAAADQARAAEHALSSWAERECAERADPDRPGRWRLDGFDRLPGAVRTRMLRLLCVEAGVELSALDHQIVDAIDAAAVAQAIGGRARVEGGDAAARAPKGWDLHRNRRLHVEKDAIRVEVDEGSNH